MFITIVSFIAFTSLVAIISYMVTRKDKMTTSDAYFLGGRSLTAWVIAGSLMLTNLSTEHLIGLNGDAFKHTIAVMAWETTAALAMVLTALYFLPKYLKSGFVTIPQYLSERYDDSTRVIATLLFLFSYIVAILPVVLLFGAAGVESLFDVSENLGISYSQSIWILVWGIGTLGSLYAIFGGLKAVAISDTINGLGFLIVGLMVPVLALMYIGDGDMFAGFSEVFHEEHEKFDITGDEPGSFLPFGVLFTGMIVNQIFFWCTNQSIIQRALGAKNLAEGQKGVLIAAGFKLIGPLIIVLPGVIAFHMFKGVLGPEDYLMAYPMLVKTVLPSALVGFFAAVMVGAVLSTFNSVLNSSATLFSQGIYMAIFNKEATGRQLVFSGRVISIILALAAMIAAPLINTDGSLYNYLQKINATFFGPMLAVIMLGFLTKKVSAKAAKIGLLGGPVAFYLLTTTFDAEIQSFLMNVFNTPDQIHFLHMLAFVFVLTVVVMLVVSKFYPAEKTYVQKYTHDVDITPWKYAKHAGITISVITVMFYILLAQ
ncbi:MAG: solute:sodium symporter family transporter [Alphaproteobacteria bacterium]|nr:MAG: solute:sodium symporter family transporter [Alphaproteobacteria bacterium]